MPLKDVSTLDEDTYNPREGTALNDAICTTIENELSGVKPHNKVFLIVTDGAENSSQQYSFNNRVNMIKKVRDEYDWKVIFIGANLDVTNEASSMGIDLTMCAEFDQSSPGDLLTLARQTSSTIADYRRSRTQGDNDADIVLSQIDKQVSCPVDKKDKDVVIENMYSSLCQPLPLKRVSATLIAEFPQRIKSPKIPPPIKIPSKDDQSRWHSISPNTPKPKSFTR
jgi:hypothetical protein